MKKLITLLAALLVGAGSVFAQYDVDVSWSYDNPYYCQNQLSNLYEFKITLDIYDVVNNEQVASEINYEDWDETETNFTAEQTGVEDWCDKATSTPNLRTIVLVEMVLISNPNSVYCNEWEPVYKTCGQFSNGISFSFTFY